MTQGQILWFITGPGLGGLWDYLPRPMLATTRQEVLSGVGRRVGSGGSVGILHLVAHGGPGKLQFGQELFLVRRDLLPLLRDLKPYFAPSAEVWIHGCEVAQSFSAISAARGATSRVRDVTVKMSLNAQNRWHLGMEGLVVSIKNGGLSWGYEHAHGEGPAAIWHSVLRLCFR